MQLVAVSLLLIWAEISCVWGNSAGPPVGVCPTLMPDTGPHGQPVDGNGGYIITTDIPINGDNTGYDYEADTTYTVTLTGNINTFRGFAVQSVTVPGEAAVGSFTPQGANQQLLACTPPDYTIVHSNPPPSMDFDSMTFTWIAPSTAGTVDFLYTVVETRPGPYYVRNSAIAEFLQQQQQMPPPGVTTPTTAAADYPVVFKSPSSCDVSNCTVYVGIEVNEGNDDYLNFYIEGDAEAWVAVGFSPSRSMPNADVLACNRVNGSEDVEVLDTYNVMDTRNNIPDTVMDTFTFSSSVENGRIFCSFGRSIVGNGDDQDFDLDNDYYVMYGRSNGATSAQALMFHTSNNNPTLTDEQVNVVDGGITLTTNIGTVALLAVVCLVLTAM